MSTHAPVAATITRRENNQVLAVPVDQASAPAGLRGGVWTPARDFQVGEAVTLHWHSTASRGLWSPVRAA